jgi:hypothetical protein
MQRAKAIFESKGFNERLFGSEVLGALEIAPRDAIHLEKTMRIAIALAPKPPFFGAGATTASATIDDPVEVEEQTFVIIADIECGLLLDGKGRVLGSYRAR